MLEHGLKGMHGAAIRRPSRRTDHPDPQRLDEWLQRFLLAA